MGIVKWGLGNGDWGRGPYTKSKRFLAYKDGKIAGRVIAIINDIANRDWHHKEVRSGWIAFIDDKEVAKP